MENIIKGDEVSILYGDEAGSWGIVQLARPEHNEYHVGIAGSTTDVRSYHRNEIRKSIPHSAKPKSLVEQYAEVLRLTQDALIKAELLLATVLASDLDRELGSLAVEAVTELKRVRNHVSKKIND